MASNSYSFLDVQCAITGPGGSFSIGSSAGIAEEGISVELEGDKDTMTIGADGSVMHSLHAARAGTVTVRLLKTSPVNSDLATMYNFQTTTSANNGQNTISVRDPVRGDSITAQSCAFKKLPNNINATVGGLMEWLFNAGQIDEILGDGSPVSGT